MKLSGHIGDCTGLKVVVGSLATQGREGPNDETSMSACDKIASKLHTGVGETLSSERAVWAVPMSVSAFDLQ